MQQIDPGEEVVDQVRKLNEAYRNLYNRVEQLEKLVNNIDAIVVTGTL